MPNVVYIASSLDGFIARKDGTIDWLLEIPNPEKSDYGFSSFMETIDAVVMGRNTFETVLSFKDWPYSVPVFILSNKLKEIPEDYRQKAELINGNLVEILESLNTKGLRKLYIDGGKTIQSFLKNDLIDELIITRIPILLGSGIPLFSEMEFEIRFELVKTEILNKQLVKSTYRKSKPQ